MLGFFSLFLVRKTLICVQVVLSTFMSIPVMLYGLGLHEEGWTWVHVSAWQGVCMGACECMGAWGVSVLGHPSPQSLFRYYTDTEGGA